MIPKFCEECPYKDWDYVRVGSYTVSWDECPEPRFDPALLGCPRHEEYLEKLREEAEEDDID